MLSGTLQHGTSGIGHITLTPRDKEIEAAREDLAAEATRTAPACINGVAKAASRGVADVVRIAMDPDAAETAEVNDVNAPSVALPKMVERPSPPMAVAAGDAEISVIVAVMAELSRQGG